MLKIHIPETNREFYSDKLEEFVTIKCKETEIVLEHSLISISKWEAKYHKPFLSNTVPKTDVEMRDYIRFMSLTSNIDPNVYLVIPNSELERIAKYIEDPQSATTFSDQKNGKTSREIITSELIYYWMVALQIPFECQKWHINRLLTLIKICNIKNQPGKKMSPKDVMAQNRALNASRRARLHSRG